tara:strand:+ start:283 stop:504 length:222 start_codon:yes stop_codon:yes gene_type:complete
MGHSKTKTITLTVHTDCTDDELQNITYLEIGNKRAEGYGIPEGEFDDIMAGSEGPIEEQTIPEIIITKVEVSK